MYRTKKIKFDAAKENRYIKIKRAYNLNNNDCLSFHFYRKNDKTQRK